MSRNANIAGRTFDPARIRKLDFLPGHGKQSASPIMAILLADPKEWVLVHGRDAADRAIAEISDASEPEEPQGYWQSLGHF